MISRSMPKAGDLPIGTVISTPYSKGIVIPYDASVMGLFNEAEKRLWIRTLDDGGCYWVATAMWAIKILSPLSQIELAIYGIDQCQK